MGTKKQKIISSLIIFVMMISYTANTLQALADSDEISVITNGFSSNNLMKFEAYFGAKETKNVSSDVNNKAVLTFELSPKNIGKGFLKEGIIKAKGENETNPNFIFSKILNVTTEEVEEEAITIETEESDTEEIQNEIDENEETEESDTNIKNEIEEITNTVNNEDEIIEEIENTADDENEVVENKIETNDNENSINSNNGTDIILDEDILVENIIEEEQRNEVTSRENETRQDDGQNDIINEDNYIDVIFEEEETYEEMTAKDFEITITSDNEITVKNIIFNTKIEVEIEFPKNDLIDLADLYKTNNVKLNGNYINTKLEKSATEKSDEITVGWTYSQKINLDSKYEKSSKFKLENDEGIILENKTVLSRNQCDNNILPLKETKLEVLVPEINGMLPSEINVSAIKLMATRGEDVGETNFSKDNWSYDENNKKITITINSDENNLKNGVYGEDEFEITYRYNTYVENETITVDNNVKAVVEQYNSDQNIFIEKEVNDVNEVNIEENNLITYTIKSQDTNINKAKIIANYNSAEAKYESDFESYVNVNILTSDVVKEFVIDCSKEVYIDKNGARFDATKDVYCKEVKFNYSELSELFQNGSSLEIQNVNGEILYVLNNSLLMSENDCDIVLAEKQKGIHIVLKDINKNGNVSIELKKTIGKSSYAKSAFTNFEKIESYISANLMYSNSEENYSMSEISTLKKFDNTKTYASLEMANNSLSTISENNDVELRIVLNNNDENSDLYINPSFEIVFPEYIVNVSINNIGIIYNSNLEISNYKVYKDNGLEKLLIEVRGTQTEFSNSSITNGTNIVVNLNLELNEYTPKNKNQIIMYYYNEGVTNYEVQTSWKINKNEPTGILRDTNGFDAKIIYFQGDNGLITSNAIINYDGNGSKISSINNGEKTVEISEKGNSIVATMELVAMNGTGNTCTDLVLIGKIPFKDNKDVITNQDLGTTLNASMVSAIKEDVYNKNESKIYYSTNENPTLSLVELKNDWKETPADVSQVKTFMIVVKGKFLAGSIQKYTYEFEIPANIGFSQKIFGSFGGYYNNVTEETISFESTEADKVGLITKEKDAYDFSYEKIINGVTISVYPNGQNDNIYYGQVLNLVVKVENTSENDIANKELKLILPTGTVFTKSEYQWNDMNGLDQVFVDDETTTTRIFNIENLLSGDSVEFNCDVRVLDSDEESKVLVGNVIFDDVTKEYALKAQKSKLKISTELYAYGDVSYKEGDEIIYIVRIEKTTDENVKNLVLSSNMTKYFQMNQVQMVTYNDESEISDDDYKDIQYTYEYNKLTIEIGDLKKDHIDLNIVGKIGSMDVQKVTMNNVFTVYSEDDRDNIYSSNKVSGVAENTFIEVTHSINKSEFSYNDEFEYYINISNKSGKNANITLFNGLTDNFSVNEVKMYINDVEQENVQLNEYGNLIDIPEYGNVLIIAKGIVEDIDNANENYDIESYATVIVNSENEKELKSSLLNIKIYKFTDYQSASEMAESAETEEKTYSISGNVYLDSNLNGTKDYDEINVNSQIQVKLLKDSQTIKATTLDENGEYTFSDLENGEYTVMVNYDQNTYNMTTSDINGISIANIDEGVAVTDVINVNGSSVENENIGLQEIDKFDLQINQYIKNATVTVNGKEMSYDFDDVEIGKVEIDEWDLNKSDVKFTYKIVVKNVGNVVGQATSIVDYIPNGLIFDQAENSGWSLGTVNGNIYYNGLKGIDIEPGESQEITLILNKNMSEDSLGIISNKVYLAYTNSEIRITENTTNNYTSQEMILTIPQGLNNKKTRVIITISFIIIAGIFAYMVETRKITISFNMKKAIKRIYK